MTDGHYRFLKLGCKNTIFNRLFFTLNILTMLGVSMEGLVHGFGKHFSYIFLKDLSLFILVLGHFANRRFAIFLSQIVSTLPFSFRGNPETPKTLFSGILFILFNRIG